MLSPSHAVRIFAPNCHDLKNRPTAIVVVPDKSWQILEHWHTLQTVLDMFWETIGSRADFCQISRHSWIRLCNYPTLPRLLRVIVQPQCQACTLYFVIAYVNNNMLRDNCDDGTRKHQIRIRHTLLCPLGGGICRIICPGMDLKKSARHPIVLNMSISVER
jgi:hypothetical protein